MESSLRTPSGGANSAFATCLDKPLHAVSSVRSEPRLPRPHPNCGSSVLQTLRSSQNKTPIRLDAVHIFPNTYLEYVAHSMPRRANHCTENQYSGVFCSEIYTTQTSVEKNENCVARTSVRRSVHRGHPYGRSEVRSSAKHNDVPMMCRHILHMIWRMFQHIFCPKSHRCVRNRESQIIAWLCRIE